MAAEADGSKSSASADSYIGSLISLTSKSEIRYEGILYTINADESSIGLRNVRSFGTEGRKKDGPQVPPGDKVYEYILFRGSDIKDLQVKNSPPAQSPPPINNDPAIIQSHYPHPTSTSTSLPSTGTGSLTYGNSHAAQVGLPSSNFQGGIPLYQPGANVGPWGPSPPQLGANGSGVAMPIYWQGYYGTPNGPQQQPMFRPPTGLPMPPSMQPPMQYHGFNNSFGTGAPNLSDFSYPMHPGPINSVNMTPTSISPLTLPLAALPSETTPNSLPAKAPISTPVSSSMPSLYPLTTSGTGINANVPPISNKPTAVSGLNLPYQAMPQTVSSILGAANSTITEAPTPSLITPGQLLQSGHTTISSAQPLQTAHKDVQMVQVSSSAPLEPSVPVSTAAQPPILPLPTPSRAVPRVNGHSFQARHGYRGRERGRGIGGYRPVMKFTEEFDFMAMNEKFNKDEVWGDLGKGNKSHSRDKEGDGNISDENNYDDEDDAESSTKTVYNKDDFFDSLSSNALDRESNHGRTRFSEQQKIDTETFGEFSRYRGGRGFNRGGRGFNRGGNGYYGRGYGYNNNNRGRGRGYSNQAN